MHENREISSTPWSDDHGRSAKAISRTADMHVLEKSDCAVVPVNQPNKEGQPSAEAGEGRAQTRENIVQSHMHPTQSGKRMSQGLDGVRKAARERIDALDHTGLGVKHGVRSRRLVGLADIAVPIRSAAHHADLTRLGPVSFTAARSLQNLGPLILSYHPLELYK